MAYWTLGLLLFFAGMPAFLFGAKGIFSKYPWEMKRRPV